MAPRTVVLKGDPLRKEGVAAGAITPGHLVKWSSGELVVHASEAGYAQKMVAVEEDFAGRDIDDAYADGETVQYVVPRPGDELYMWLGTGNDVAKGDPLGSGGDGTLDKLTIAATTVEGAIVGYAHEAIDNDPGSAAVRIRVEMA